LHRLDLYAAWDLFKNKLTDLVDLFIPRITVKGGGKPRWLNPEIKKLLASKKAAWRKFKREGGSANKQAYDEIAKRTKKGIRNAKRGVEKNLAFK
jgi:pyocin large subunit-like protein